MDVFYEQLVSIKKSPVKILLIILIWLLAVGLSALALLLLQYIGVLLAAALLYGAYRISGLMSVEYEYILTNGEMDIDKIVAKSSRSRMITFKCGNIEKISEFDGTKPANGKFILCASQDNTALIITVKHNKEGIVNLVMSPNERMTDEMKKYLQYSVKRELEGLK